jgi:ribonuclease HI
MSEPGVVTIYTDGAARGNPGPAAFAYVIRRHGAVDIEEKGLLGKTTNNIAEYEALVRALEHARLLGARRVQVLSDSELLVRQMLGEYQVKNEGLRPLYEQAGALRRQFDGVTFRHVRRSENGRADRLCNEALDGHRPAPAKAAPRPKAPAARPVARDTVREEALECLRAVAAAWARGNANDPRPEDVWEQLWSILEEGGALRAVRPRREG